MLCDVRYTVEHTAARWARAVTSVTAEVEDPHTLRLWARAAGASGSTLRSLCRAAHTSAKDSLDFARLLRAVVVGQSLDDWDLANLLNVSDSRTLMRLIARGGLHEAVRRRRPPAPVEFLDTQDLVLVASNLRAVSHELRARCLLYDRATHSFS